MSGPGLCYSESMHRDNSKWSLFRAFKYAWRGLVRMVRTKVNIKIQLAIFLLVVFLSVFFGFNTGQLALVLVVSALVLSLEVVNTAVEELADIVSPQYDEKIGSVKDIMAAAVMIVSVAASVVGVILFLPPLLVLFRSI